MRTFGAVSSVTARRPTRTAAGTFISFGKSSNRLQRFSNKSKQIRAVRVQNPHPSHSHPVSQHATHGECLLCMADHLPPTLMQPGRHQRAPPPLLWKTATSIKDNTLPNTAVALVHRPAEIRSYVWQAITWNHMEVENTHIHILCQHIHHITAEEEVGGCWASLDPETKT